MSNPWFEASRVPGRDTLVHCLGGAIASWDAVTTAVRGRAPELAEVWHFAGPKVGWSLRLIDKARILVYLTPEQGRFRIGLVLGGKAVASARASGLSPAAASILDIAPRYAEGHGVRFHVASRDDLEALETLLDIKFATARKSAAPRSGR
jgi:hypothetical protein